MNGLVECTMCLCQTFMFAFMPTVLCFSGKDPLPYFLLIQAKVYFHVSSVFPWQHPKCSLLDGVFNIHLQFNTPDTFKNVYNFFYICSIRVSLTLSCPMNLKLYPLDRQMCPMQIASCKVTIINFFKTIFKIFFSFENQKMDGPQMTLSTYGRRKTQFRWGASMVMEKEYFER